MAAAEERPWRRRREVRARTINVGRITKEQMRYLRALYPPTRHHRPTVRAECVHGPRPCPFVGCRWHLYMDVSPIGSIKLNFPDLEVWEMAETCALDVADRGGVTLEEIGEDMNLTRERVRQIELCALGKLRESGELEDYL